jgi:hypothetical protein
MAFAARAKHPAAGQTQLLVDLLDALLELGLKALLDLRRDP